MLVVKKVTKITKPIPNNRNHKCKRCDEWIWEILEFEDGSIRELPDTNKNTLYCDECRKEVTKEIQKKSDAKNNRLKPKRKCKICAVELEGGKTYCAPCLKEKERNYRIKNPSYKRVKDPKIKLITNEEERLLIECVQTGISSPRKIQIYLEGLGINRSSAFIWKHLKRLGIYKEWDNKTGTHYLYEAVWKKRNEWINETGWRVIKDNTQSNKVWIACNQCNKDYRYSRIKIRNGKCFNCEVKNKREEREKQKSENIDKKISAKNQKYNNRIQKIKEYIDKGEKEWNTYKGWKHTPIYKEYRWYKSQNNKEYHTKELDYKLDWISYYVYRDYALCPDRVKEGNKKCRICREEKGITEFRGRGRNGYCKECAKQWRRDNILEDEVKRYREKYHSDPLFKLDSLIRAYVYGALKGKKKGKRTKEILGIEWWEFKKYIEERFEDWMNWDNHGMGKGRWALQHIIPREFAKDEKEIYLLNHYQNFIPMCSIKNGILKNRVLKEQMNGWHNSNKGIQKILKRNKDKIFSINDIEFSVVEIDTTIQQNENKLTKWFAY